MFIWKDRVDREIHMEILEFVTSSVYNSSKARDLKSSVGTRVKRYYSYFSKTAREKRSSKVDRGG